MEELSKKLKEELIDNLTSSDILADEDYLIAGNKKYTRREIANEIENETEFGIKFMTNMLSLTIDLVARDKIKNKYKNYEQKN